MGAGVSGGSGSLMHNIPSEQIERTILVIDNTVSEYSVEFLSADWMGEYWITLHQKILKIKTFKSIRTTL